MSSSRESIAQRTRSRAITTTATVISKEDKMSSSRESIAQRTRSRAITTTATVISKEDKMSSSSIAQRTRSRAITTTATVISKEDKMSSSSIAQRTRSRGLKRSCQKAPSVQLARKRKRISKVHNFANEAEFLASKSPMHAPCRRAYLELKEKMQSQIDALKEDLKRLIEQLKVKFPCDKVLDKTIAKAQNLKKKKLELTVRFRCALGELTF
eukprot:TRINITY_DN116_c0_g1_i2.p1 TRINITY_DN116_c0_g1~~TRINITY_DN116_c0_g1_i2.p1  ORF type:complete len:212 (-),score=26.83 TRINITY_DN116_c0_g1_i2:12-647(-)